MHYSYVYQRYIVKERLIHMNQYKQRLVGNIIISAMLFLVGCQPAPESNAVLGKNTEHQDFGTLAPTAVPYTSAETEHISFKSDFKSTDESVHFVMDIQQDISTALPFAVHVTPHQLTETDAKRCAYAIFPDADFYEPQPLIAPVFSKSEIQDKIALWSQYTSVDELRELYGEEVDEQYINSTATLIKEYIEDYTLKYESAPESNVHAPCVWKMRKSSDYMYTAEELAEVDTSDDNDELSAQCYIDGIPYYYTVSTRNRKDFTVNAISCVIFDGPSPRSIENKIRNAQLCRTLEPTVEQLADVKKKAERILSNMDLGQWWIDECYVETETPGNQTEYYVTVNAVPAFNGVPVMRRTQLQSLRNEDGYAASEYFTDANFRFSTNGELITFMLYTPLETNKVVYDDVHTLDMMTLLQRAQEVFKLTDAYAYPFGSYLNLIKEPVQCNIAVSEIKSGLSRIKEPNHEGRYCYVPAVQFKGTVEYIGTESGKLFYKSNVPESLLHINAIDGTIINEVNS